MSLPLYGVGGGGYYAAKVNDSTGAPGNPRWNPFLNNYVNKILVKDGYVYLAGDFTAIGQISPFVSRYFIARVGASKAVIDSLWEPNPGGYVYDMTIVNNKLYLVGSFKYMGNKNQKAFRVARVSLNYTGETDTTWRPNTDGTVYCIASQVNNILLGGAFKSEGGLLVNNLLRIRNTDFSIDSNWRPNPGEGITTLAVDDKYVYLGGSFSHVDTTGMQYLARVNKSNGVIDASWYPEPNNSVGSIALNNHEIFIAGRFTKIFNQNRHYLAKLDYQSGMTDPNWHPDPANSLIGSIEHLGIHGPYLYASGRFSNEDRTKVVYYLRRLNLSDGKEDPHWNPQPHGLVWNFAFYNNNLIATGAFSQMGGNLHKGTALISLTNGQVNPQWQIDIDKGTVEDVTVQNHFAYLAGSFSAIAGQHQPLLARVNLCSNQLDTQWQNNIENSSGIFDAEVNLVYSHKNNIFIGGFFDHINHLLLHQVAVFQENPNPSLAGTTCTAIGTGPESLHTLVIRADGKLFGWGADFNGQLGNNATQNSHVPVAVDTSGSINGKTFRELACGNDFSMALSEEGVVYTWGGDTLGQLGINATTRSLVPAVLDTTGVLSGKTVTHIAAGGYFGMALADGKVYGWGRNPFGSNAQTQQFTKSTLVPVAINRSGVLKGKEIIAIAAGDGHALALGSNGLVYAWGSNRYGQAGNNSDSAVAHVPVIVDTTGILAGKKIITIAAGGVHSLALASDGTVYAWGRNNMGQLGDNTFDDSRKPVAVNLSAIPSGEKVIAIAAGGDLFSMALTDKGKVYTWGYNGAGQLGIGTSENSGFPIPHAVSTSDALAGKKIVAIAADYNHCVALSCDGKVFTWGGNDHGQLGNNLTDANVSSPVQLNWEITAVNQNQAPENRFDLAQNYPNPFRYTTEIRYSVPASVSGQTLQNVTLKIFDLFGRCITTLVNRKQSPGNYKVQFNAAGLKPGIYLYKLKIGNRVKAGKMMLLK